MTPQAYEIATLARTSWMLALSDSVDEMIAIACTIRNHIVPSVRSDVQFFSGYTHACASFLKAYPVRHEPTLTEEAFINPERGLLATVDKIYNCEYPDITATQTTQGALYFARVASLTPEDWRRPRLIGRPPIGTFGAQQFFS